MNERTSGTPHGDAPPSTAYEPDARASALQEAREDDEFIARTTTVGRPVTELYAFLSGVPNLRRIIGEEDEIDWDTVILEEELPGRTITWRSSGREDRRFSGRIELREAPAGRGTEVTVTVVYEARGIIGKTIDKLRQRDPRLVARRALRRFKQLMETGEIATSAPGPAAPRGD